MPAVCIVILLFAPHSRGGMKEIPRARRGSWAWSPASCPRSLERHHRCAWRAGGSHDHSPGEAVRTGVTAILPHGGNLFLHKARDPSAFSTGTGSWPGRPRSVSWGVSKLPSSSTNTLSVGTAVEAVVRFTLEQPGCEDVRSINAVVGETNDGRLNDIRGLHVRKEDVCRRSGRPGRTGC